MWFVPGHTAVGDKAGNNIQSTSPRFQRFLRPELLNTKPFPVDCCPLHKLGCFAVSKDAWQPLDRSSAAGLWSLSAVLTGHRRML